MDFPIGTASDEAVAAEATAAGVPTKPVVGATEVAPLTTEDIPAKPAAKKAAKKKGK